MKGAMMGAMKTFSLPSPRRAIPALLALVLAAGAARSGRQGSDGAARAAAQRTVILVRHAEKAADDPRDPALSEAGRERARALAQLLARSGARRLVASEYRRTRETLAPLSEALGVALESFPARELEALAKDLAGTPAGSTVVVAGHSNTVPALAARLGAPLAGVTEGAQGPALDEQEYDRLFVLTLPPAGSALAPAVLELAYGRASP
jgi:phosphohistidine phosphatase SixA